jgi:putative two-component system response regulator
MRGSRRILIVDDEDAVRRTLARYLAQHTGVEIDEAENGHRALELLGKNDYFMVVTDISMPELGGLELLSEVRRSHPHTDVAVITGHQEIDYAIQALKNGAFDYFRKPFRFEEVLSTVDRVRHKQYLEQRSIELELLKERQTADERHFEEMLRALAHIIDFKSPYTRAHSDRVSKIAVLMARRFALSQAEVDRIALGSALHDIGKLGCPDCILDKPGQLTPEERAIIQEHPGRGAELCGHISTLQPVIPMIRWHHENLDGSGYPDKLAGHQIPLDARIVRIADYWDAITSKRSYRNPMPVDQAKATIENECERGKLDPEGARALFDCLIDGSLSGVRAAEQPRFAFER